MTIPYTRETWVDDTTLATASRLNNIEVGIVDAHKMPAVRVYHNANQSITNTTNTALAFNSERFDQAGGSASTQHDVSTNNSRLTCRHAGVYHIIGGCHFAANATGQRTLFLRLNGATAIAYAPRGFGLSSLDSTSLLVATHYDLAVNDYIEMVVYQDSGGALNVLNGANYSPEFSMTRVG